MLIIHRETPPGILHAWYTLCGQWTTQGTYVTDQDTQTTCKKCIKSIKQLRKRQAEFKRQALKGVHEKP